MRHGSFDFLLIVTTRRIRKEAVAQAIAKSAEEEPTETVTLPKKIVPKFIIPEELLVKKTALNQMLPAIAPPVDLNEPLRESITHLQTELEKEKQQAKSILQKKVAEKKQADQTQQNILAVQQQKLKLQQKQSASQLSQKNMADALTKTTQQIAYYRTQTRKHRHQMATQSSKYQLMPYEGDSGTTRKPILIECTSQSIRFLQEEITLTATELEGFTAQYNPLLMGSKALADYWDKKNVETKSQAKPYVLLVVRPSGSRAFYIARALLKNLNQPFGYELIEEHVDLAIPASNSEAKEACLVAIRKTLQNRKQLLATMQINSHATTAERIRFQKGGNGFEVIDEKPDPFEREGRLLAGRNRRPRTGNSSLQNNRQTPADKQLAARDRRQGTNPFDGNPSQQRRFGQGAFDQQPTRRVDSRSLNNQPANNQQPGRSQNEGNTFRISSNSDDRKLPGAIPTGRRSNTDTNASGQRSRSTDNPLAELTPRSASTSPGHQQANRSSRNTSDHRGAASGQQNPFMKFGSGQRNSSGNQASQSSQTSQSESLQLHSSFENSRQGNGQRFHRNGIGFERTIPIMITSSQLTVGDEKSVSVGKGESQKELRKALIISLNRHVHTWGPPPKGFYWVPKVKFRISPGGNQYYSRVQGSLLHMGIDSTTDYLLDTGGKQE